MTPDIASVLQAVSLPLFSAGGRITTTAVKSLVLTPALLLADCDLGKLRSLSVPQLSGTDVRAGPWRRQSTQELMLLNCGVGENS